MTELRSIDYPDIPEVAIRELEAFFDHDDEDKNFLSLIAEEEANFPARVLDKIHALAEEGAGSGSCNPRSDVICEVFMNGSRHEQLRVEIFLRLESNIAFHLFGIHDTHYSALAIGGLNAYPGEQYDDLVKHLKAWELQDILRKNVKMLMSGSAPIDYARIKDAFEKVINSMPDLASQRDCSFIAAHVHEEVPSDEKEDPIFRFQNSMSFSQSASMSARALLDRHWDAALPVRPVAIASSAGLLVFRRADFSAGAGIEHGDDGRLRIMLGAAPDSEQAKLRERFAIAHALSHIALSHFVPGDLPHQDVASHFSLSATSPIERAANDFAMALLVPEDALEVILRDRRSISEIASIFVVSEVALQQRLIDLGMLPRKGTPLRM